jgi:hypothetical protein
MICKRVKQRSHFPGRVKIMMAGERRPVLSLCWAMGSNSYRFRNLA